MKRNGGSEGVKLEHPEVPLRRIKRKETLRSGSYKPKIYVLIWELRPGGRTEEKNYRTRKSTPFWFRFPSLPDVP